MKNQHSRFSLTVIFLLALLLTLIVGGGQVSAQDEAGVLLGRINGLRASVGRPPYSLNSALNAAAQSQAQWMVDTGTIAHTRPDGSTPRTRALNSGYPSAMVSENIYGGSNASVDVAWTFWINSSIHYAGLVSPNYAEVGIGIAGGSWGRAYVLVFGNPGGSYAAPAASGSGAARPAAEAPAQQRIYAIGVDEAGNIMHLIATGDTLGDIALIYGYTWDDIPAMMALNQLEDARELLPGEVFLVPPKQGTFTPTPGGPTPTDTPTITPLPPTITPYVAVIHTPIPEGVIPTPQVGGDGSGSVPSDELATIMASEIVQPATLEAMQAAGLVAPMGLIAPTELPTDISASPTAPQESTAVAALDTPMNAASTLVNADGTSPRSPTSQWIVIALLVQVGIVVMAGIEFARRSIRARSRKLGVDQTRYMGDIRRTGERSPVIGTRIKRKVKP